MEPIITENQPNRTEKPRYRGLTYRRPITAAKELIPCIDLADRLAGAGKLRKVGSTWSARCVLPDHEDRIPSFVVYPETNSFFCFGCLRGGDVVELARLAWGYDERDAHTAAGMLLLEFGHEVPGRPQAYFRKQKRQKPLRDVIAEAKFEHVRRRLFRRFFKASVMAIEDEEEREAEYQVLWEATRPLAQMLLADLEARRAA